jgi:hypothetical protein
MTDSLLVRPGSTRAVSLVRVLVALLIWSEFGDTFRLVSSFHDPAKLALGTTVWLGSFAMLAGWWSRAASLVTGVTLLTCWQVLGELGGDDHFRRHHVYTLAVTATLLSLTPCGGSFSLDRVRAGSPPEVGDLWAVTLIKLQVVAMYLWAAYDKSFPAFRYRMEHYTSDHYFGAEHPGPWFATAMMVAGYGSVVLEYALPFALWWPRSRPVALVAGVLFHAVLYWTLSVATYTCTMFTLYVLFVDPSTVHRWLGSWLGLAETERSPA